MSYISESYEAYLGTAATLLSAEGMIEASEILRKSAPKIEETGFDNWNGGTKIWTIYLQLDPENYATLGTNRESLQEQIEQRLKPTLEQHTNDWFGVKIVPEVKLQPDWRQSKRDISLVVRQNIFDALRVGNVVWNGNLDEVEFLERLYDLQKIPSQDSRFTDVAGDIWQHRVNNPEDWDDDWIYSDQRFNLLRGSSEHFLRFICQIVHPVVRHDRNETLKLVHDFNSELRKDGWQLVEKEQIAGRPRFVGNRIENNNLRSVTRAKTVADALDAGWMQKEIERVEAAVESDPALAIGTAKDLIETCCKSILTKRGVELPASIDLPKLTKLLTKELKLVPEGISDEAKGAESIRLILRNLSVLTQYIAELRGLYGSGHGRNGKHRGLEPRHARLAVGAAIAFIDFVTETYHQRHVTEEDKGK